MGRLFCRNQMNIVKQTLQSENYAYICCSLSVSFSKYFESGGDRVMGWRDLQIQTTLNQKKTDESHAMLKVTFLNAHLMFNLAGDLQARLSSVFFNQALTNLWLNWLSSFTTTRKMDWRFFVIKLVNNCMNFGNMVSINYGFIYYNMTLFLGGLS